MTTKEAIRHLKRRGYKVRRLRRQWRCDGEPAEARAAGILGDDELHELAVYSVRWTDQLHQEVMCPACVVHTAETIGENPLA